MAYLGSKVNLSRYDLQSKLLTLKKNFLGLKKLTPILKVALLDLDYCVL
jgi:hypothetical protein